MKLLKLPRLWYTFAHRHLCALQWAIEERGEGGHYPPQEHPISVSPSFLLSHFLIFLRRLPVFALSLSLPPVSLSSPRAIAPHLSLFPPFSVSLFLSGHFTVPRCCLSLTLHVLLLPLCCHGFRPLSLHPSFRVRPISGMYPFNGPGLCATEQGHEDLYVPTCKWKDTSDACKPACMHILSSLAKMFLFSSTLPGTFEHVKYSNLTLFISLLCNCPDDTAS